MKTGPERAPARPTHQAHNPMNAKLTFGLTAGITGMLLLTATLLNPAQAPAGSAGPQICGDSTSYVVRKLAYAAGECP